jgi:hypothetical protein
MKSLFDYEPDGPGSVVYFFREFDFGIFIEKWPATK